MTLKRRSFLQGALAAATLPAVPHAANASVRRLTAGTSNVQLAPPDFPPTEVWAYGNSVPGPELRYAQGDVLDLRLSNELDQPTTIHWHGLRLPNAMDGVPDMTQPAVQPGQEFEYRFTLPDAGTFWYHPHANSLEQLSRGLSGVLIVDEAAPPDVDAEHVLVLDDWRLTNQAQIHPSFDNRHDSSHAGRLGNYVTVNGTQDVTERHPKGTRLRLRLVNTATARIFRLRLSGMQAWIAALDGMPLERPEETQELVIGPAQRVDLIADITADVGDEAVIASVEQEGTFATVIFDVTGPGLSTRATPAPLAPNPLPQINLAGARRQALEMQGGAMRGLPQQVTWNGTKMDARAAAEAGQFWVFNAIAGMTDDPLVDAARGETIRIPITNRTAFPHAMHLHGMHFREVMADGTLGPWRDTLLVHRDQTREIAFVAENPGDWMFHCHMAAHQMAGMMNWIRVT